jgi:hypothetical protein
MRCARVLGPALLLGMWAGCDREKSPGDDVPRAEVPRAEVPAEDSGSAHSPVVPDVVTAPPVGAWVRVRQEDLTWDGETRFAVASGDPYRIAEVLAIEGKFVKLRTIAAKREDLCDTTSGTDPDFEIHFFVQLDALRPVLVTPKLVEFDDGTKLAFAVGVPVDLSEPEPSLQLGGENFIVPLTKQEIGWWFPAAPAQPPADPGFLWSLSKPLHYGERSIEPWGPPFDDFRDSRIVGSNTFLTFADACGEFTLRIEGDVPRSKSGLYVLKGPKDAIPQMANVDPEVARRAALLGIPASEAESWGLVCGPTFEAPAGVALTWQDSAFIAGVTRRKVQLPRTAQESAGKLCFTTGGMAVCIASDLLTSTGGRDCLSFGEGQTLESLYIDPGGGLTGREAGEDVKDGEVRQLKAEVSPGLDADIVRRVVRAHINELRSCDKSSRAKQPELAGTITIAFEIAASGKVSSSTVQESKLTPAEEALPTCFAKAVKRWQFPKPTGADPVRVTYPFAVESK